MEKVILDASWLKHMYYILEYFNYSNRDSVSVSEAYIKNLESSSVKAEKEVPKLISFLSQEISNLNTKQYSQVIRLLTDLKKYYPEKLLVDVLLGFLSTELKDIDSEDKALVEKRLVSISWIPKTSEVFFSKEQINNETSIKKFFFWNWIDLFFDTDCDDAYIETLVVNRALFEKETKGSLIRRMTYWRHPKEAMVLGIIDKIVKDADFDVSPLVRWKNKRYPE
jgi:hypothetical protein